MDVVFHPTEEDLRIIETHRRQDEETSDVIRRALQLLTGEAREGRVRAEMRRLKSTDLAAKADAQE